MHVCDGVFSIKKATHFLTKQRERVSVCVTVCVHVCLCGVVKSKFVSILDMCR